MTLKSIHQKIKKCTKCRLKFFNAVPGEGPKNAQIMLVGQNPGKKEDETGKPFQGRAGKYLNLVLEKNSIDRTKLFITSIVKHKTPNNRKPKKDEIKACTPYLEEQIKAIAPEVVVLMGKFAQKAKRLPGIKYIETYHPAAAMRFPGIRKKFEKDFKALGENK